MGINSHLKILVGVKLNKEQTEYIGYYDPDFPDDYEGKDLELAKKIYSTFDTVYDYYTGEFLYIGKELFESEDGRYNPWDFAESFYVKDLIDTRVEIYRQLYRSDLILPIEWQSADNMIPELHIFVHLT